MIAGTALVLSDEELGVLWTVAGRPPFGYVPWPELDAATLEAVARGLLARGIIRDGDAPALAPDVERLLEVALFSEQMLRCTVNDFGPRAAASGQEVFWRSGTSLVWHTPSFTGTHRFADCDRSAVDAMLAGMLLLADAPAQRDGPPLTLAERDHVDLLEAVEREGAAAAAARQPELAGYLDALTAPHRATSFEVRDSAFAGGELSLLDSPRHGLWLARDGAEGGVAIQRVATQTARDRVSELAETFA